MDFSFKSTRAGQDSYCQSPMAVGHPAGIETVGEVEAG